MQVSTRLLEVFYSAIGELFTGSDYFDGQSFNEVVQDKSDRDLQQSSRPEYGHTGLTSGKGEVGSLPHSNGESGKHYFAGGEGVAKQNSPNHGEPDV